VKAESMELTPDPNQIFTEEIPVVGRVPILFFLPQNCQESQEISKLINNHGGLVITVVECCTF
jgi:hypothetical protein